MRVDLPTQEFFDASLLIDHPHEPESDEAMQNVIAERRALGTVSSWEWLDSAVCGEIDPDLFNPEKGQGNEEAKRICRTRCLVRVDCLLDALKGDDSNIRAGYSQVERRRLKKLLSK